MEDRLVNSGVVVVRLESEDQRNAITTLNNISDEVFDDPKLNRACDALPQNYNFEIHKTVRRIRAIGAKRVGLQLPEGITMVATTLCDMIEAFTEADTVIMLDETHIDNSTAASLGVDLLVDYGQSSLISIEEISEETRLPRTPVVRTPSSAPSTPVVISKGRASRTPATRTPNSASLNKQNPQIRKTRRCLMAALNATHMPALNAPPMPVVLTSDSTPPTPIMITPDSAPPTPVVIAKETAPHTPVVITKRNASQTPVVSIPGTASTPITKESSLHTPVIITKDSAHQMVVLTPGNAPRSPVVISKGTVCHTPVDITKNNVLHTPNVCSPGRPRILRPMAALTAPEPPVMSETRHASPNRQDAPRKKVRFSRSAPQTPSLSTPKNEKPSPVLSTQENESTTKSASPNRQDSSKKKVRFSLSEPHTPVAVTPMSMRYKASQSSSKKKTRRSPYTSLSTRKLCIPIVSAPDSVPQKPVLNTSKNVSQTPVVSTPMNDPRTPIVSTLKSASSNLIGASENKTVCSIIGAPGAPISGEIISKNTPQTSIESSAKKTSQKRRTTLKKKRRYRIASSSESSNSGSEGEDQSAEEDELAPNNESFRLRLAARNMREYEIYCQENELDTLAEFNSECLLEPYNDINASLLSSEYDKDSQLAASSPPCALDDGVSRLDETAAPSPVGQTDYVGQLVETAAPSPTTQADSVGQVDEAATPIPAGRADNIYTWSQDFSTFSGQNEIYLRTPGPTSFSDQPEHMFTLIWDLPIVETIVKETNLYAWQTIAKLSEYDGLSKNIEMWQDTTVDEIYRFFAILIYMSIIKRSRLDEYWTAGVLGMPGFRALMSRNRFDMLKRFLHFVDNDTLNPFVSSRDRKTAKIKPIITHLNDKFSSLYTPQREVSLDESLLLWKGNLSWVQSIRTKAARFGIKSFDLCEAASGYTLRSVLYTGQGCSSVDGPVDGFENPTAKVVLELMDGYLDVGHMVVMDNWYNQLDLTRYLKKRKTDVLGTMNRCRKHVPDEIKRADEKRIQRGEQLALHCGDISMVAWKDVKFVTIISTFHDDKQVQVHEKVGGTKPVAIVAYNKYMGGVDLRDQKLSMYLMERKRGSKWYIKVFRRFLNISILNAYIMFTKNVRPSPLNLTHRQFRFGIAEGLLNIFKKAQVPKVRQFKCESIRLDFAPDHFPDNTEKRDGNHRARRRCKRCAALGIRKSVTTICTKCNVALCLGPCYKEYHTYRNLALRKSKIPDAI